MDFSGSDPQAKAILVKTAFELYDLILSRGGSQSMVIFKAIASQQAWSMFKPV